jgi:hypothetical protein
MRLRDHSSLCALDRAVSVGAIGANLPGAAKANRSKRNTGAEQYC